MKFSNFVSTLAIVCLTYNVDAISIQSESENFEVEVKCTTDLDYARCKGKIEVLKETLLDAGKKWNFDERTIKTLFEHEGDLKRDLEKVSIGTAS